MADPAIRRMTPEEFFARQRVQDWLTELVAGVPVPHIKSASAASGNRLPPDHR